MEEQVPSLIAGQSSKLLLNFSMIYDQALIIHYEKYDKKMHIYIVLNSVASYLFRPTIVVTFRKAFTEG